MVGDPNLKTCVMICFLLCQNNFMIAFLNWGNLVSVCGGVTQVLGSVGGVLVVMEYMPEEYRHFIAGPSLRVSLHTGALAEGVLTFVITFAVLLIMIKGPRSGTAKTLLLAISTVVLITVGASYTGPAMNPAFVSDYYYVPQWITNLYLIMLHLFVFLYTQTEHANMLLLKWYM